MPSAADDNTAVKPGQAIVRALQKNGVDTIFGLDGSHVIQIFDALHEAPDIRSVTVKHENNAAIAAETYGRLTGKPGVVVVTAGPGATNSLSGVAGAYAAGAPLVHISGGVPVGADREAFHGVDEPGFLDRAFEGVTKWSTRVERPADIVAAINKAFQVAVSGRPGPVHVEIAESALTSPDLVHVEKPAANGSATVDAAAVAEIARRINRADSVAIVAGKGAMWPAVSAQVVALAERVGAPVAHTWDGHGAMPTTHALSSGVWWGKVRSHPGAAKLVEGADLVVGIGVRPGTEVAKALKEAVGDRLALLDSADQADDRLALRASSTGALASSVEQVVDACELRATRSEVLDQCARAEFLTRRGVELEMQAHRDAGRWHIGFAIDSLIRQFKREYMVLSDVSNVKLWSPLQLPTFDVESHMQSGSWGAMGYALPAAMAAALVRPNKKVIALAGDTSFLMSCSDFGTICQLGLNVVMGVHNDGRIGMIDNMLTKAYGRAYGTETGSYNLVKFGEAFGARGIRVEEPCQLDAAWREALAVDGPVLLEFMAGHDFPWPWPVGRLVDLAESATR